MMEIFDMEKGDKLITTTPGVHLLSEDLSFVPLPLNKVITFLRQEENLLVFDIDGRECTMGPPYSGLRLISYPLEPPTTITGYKKLIRQVVQDMKETLGADEIQIECQTHGELKITIKQI